MRISDWSSDVCSSDLGPPDSQRPGDVGMEGQERFDDHVPGIADPGEAAEDAIPVHGPGARHASVAFRQVDVAEVAPGFDDRLIEALLLDVHVIGVEMDEDVVLADPLAHTAALAGGVEEMGLVAVAALQPPFPGTGRASC